MNLPIFIRGSAAAVSTMMSTSDARGNSMSSGIAMVEPLKYAPWNPASWLPLRMTQSVAAARAAPTLTLQALLDSALLGKAQCVVHDHR